MYSILLVLAISFSFITQVITAVSDHRGVFSCLQILRIELCI